MSLFDFIFRKNNKAAAISEKANILKPAATVDMEKPDQENAVFEENRYNAAQLYDAWHHADKSGKVILVGDIEVEQYDPGFEEMMESFWKNISGIDNSVQQFCREACAGSEPDSRNYIVDLSWVSPEGDKIILGYVGRFVNVELRAVLDNQLNIIDIQYQ